eukprot:TRINITY_DN41738_c0_g1_i1.p1 TRINITY_DN41738_c0_g1~~TRINITY_DN41738_c0_g1_i1.p1  ORF type:complete len:238 (-),score=22.60 TRINITY_DN41738_c0_g1_i1:183-896(-)
MANDPFLVGTWNPEVLADLAAGISDAEVKWNDAHTLRPDQLQRLTQPHTPGLVVERQIELVTSNHTPSCASIITRRGQGNGGPLKERPFTSYTHTRPGTAVEGIVTMRRTQSSQSKRRKSVPHGYSSRPTDPESFLLQKQTPLALITPEALLTPGAHLRSQGERTAAKLENSSSHSPAARASSQTLLSLVANKELRKRESGIAWRRSVMAMRAAGAMRSSIDFFRNDKLVVQSPSDD